MTSIAIRLPVALALLLAAQTARAIPPEVWVVNQGSREIDVISTSSNTVIATIDISDPDVDSVPNTPRGIAFSTSPANPGTHAFVTQDHLITVIEVATRRVLHARDIAADMLVAGLTLRGIAAAAPREFLLTGGIPAVRSNLHVAATPSTGSARFVVIDQDLLIGDVVNPVVFDDRLAAGATAIDVQVLGAPRGEQFQRVWYTAVRGGFPPLPLEVLWIQVVSSRTLGLPWVVADTRAETYTTAVGVPDALQIGAATDREQPVAPGSPLGFLENLDTAGRCAPDGDTVAVSITGPGVDSFTVLAVDRLNSVINVVDPFSCGVDTFSTGLGPVSVSTLGRDVWKAAFVANKDGDSVTRLDQNGTTTHIPLDLGASPVEVGVPRLDQCIPKDLFLAKVDNDGDDFLDDIELTWTGIGSCPAFEVQCQCMDEEPDCSCPCSCDPPDPGCVCSGIDNIAPFVSKGLGDLLFVPPWNDPTPISSPWKMLGDSVTPDFPHDDQIPANGGVAYQVVGKDP